MKYTFFLFFLSILTSSAFRISGFERTTGVESELAEDVVTSPDGRTVYAVGLGKIRAYEKDDETGSLELLSDVSTQAHTASVTDTLVYAPSIGFDAVLVFDRTGGIKVHNWILQSKCEVPSPQSIDVLRGDGDTPTRLLVGTASGEIFVFEKAESLSAQCHEIDRVDAALDAGVDPDVSIRFNTVTFAEVGDSDQGDSGLFAYGGVSASSIASGEGEGDALPVGGYGAIVAYKVADDVLTFVQAYDAPAPEGTSPSHEDAFEVLDLLPSTDGLYLYAALGRSGEVGVNGGVAVYEIRSSGKLWLWQTIWSVQDRTGVPHQLLLPCSGIDVSNEYDVEYVFVACRGLTEPIHFERLALMSPNDDTTGDDDGDSSDGGGGGAGSAIGQLILSDAYASEASLESAENAKARVVDGLDWIPGVAELAVVSGEAYAILSEDNPQSTEESREVVEVLAAYRIDSCVDGVLNGFESDVDCGGYCGGCADGEPCVVHRDCLSAQCIEALCGASSCSDGVQNGDESDVDCGGTTGCDRCDAGYTCADDVDCLSLTCDADSICTSASCDDGMKNGFESDVDCGSTRTSGCDACEVGQTCTQGSDCQTSSCSTGGVCIAGSCSDGILNNGETDVDCGGGVGGSGCPACQAQRVCVSDSDCLSVRCQSGACAESSCYDGVRNGDESDTDCGGSTCMPCDTSLACLSPSDCESRHCADGICAQATCLDRILNGGEDSVDCYIDENSNLSSEGCVPCCRDGCGRGLCGTASENPATEMSCQCYWGYYGPQCASSEAWSYIALEMLLFSPPTAEQQHAARTAVSSFYNTAEKVGTRGYSVSVYLTNVVDTGLRMRLYAFDGDKAVTSQLRLEVDATLDAMVAHMVSETGLHVLETSASVTAETQATSQSDESSGWQNAEYHLGSLTLTGLELLLAVSGVVGVATMGTVVWTVRRRKRLAEYFNVAEHDDDKGFGLEDPMDWDT